MLVATREILQAVHGYAVGGFNVYNLEGVKAVIEAAEQLESCVVLQVHPGALDVAGVPLIDLCLSYARFADVPVSVHLDQTSDPSLIQAAIDTGMSSVMADGSHLAYEKNVAFVREMALLAHRADIAVEARLGRVRSKDDDLTISVREGRLTDPAQAAEFVRQTDADLLAVCIGNGYRPQGVPLELDFQRLAAIRDLVHVPLVLHDTLGLDESSISRAISLGVRKFNVNVELRRAYLRALRGLADQSDLDLVPLMERVGDAMRAVVMQQIQRFGSADSANGW